LGFLNGVCSKIQTGFVWSGQAANSRHDADLKADLRAHLQSRNADVTIKLPLLSKTSDDVRLKDDV
jgi:hypothetical protein